jgi:glutamate synthase domain-containing protein 1
MFASPPGPAGLYDPRDERDACGVGFVVDIKGRASHGVIEQGLQILLNLLHRGACGCEANTGDGAGILIQPPDRFLRKVANALGIGLPPAGLYGVGNIFLPRDDGERMQIRALVEQIVQEEGQTLLGWRPVPTTRHVLGASAAAVMPVVEQLFVGYGGDAPGAASLAADPLRFERKLYVIRKRVEHAADGLALAARHMF